MAVTTSKVTYSLKPETVDRVQELATAWGVPKSEVIRRAVEQVATSPVVVKKETPLEIFLRIQRDGSGISPAAAAKYMKEVRRERRASGRKRG
jgi:Ribbon-helix-helix protein, copG family